VIPPETITCPECPSEEEGGYCSMSNNPIRLANGQLILVETDLATAGFAGWSHSRSYANLLSDNAVGRNGASWLLRELANLGFDSGENNEDIVVVNGANTSLWFEPDGSGGWRPKFTARDSLVHDTVQRRFVLTSPDGRRHVFYDNSSENPSALRGRLDSTIDPYGQVVNIDYDLNFRVARVEQSDGAQRNTFLYQYYGVEAGDNAGKLAEVTLELNGNPLRRARYDYYDGIAAGGSLHDLRRVRHLEFSPSPGIWRELRQTLYHYYLDEEVGGFKHGLKHVLGPQSCARLIAAGLNPLTISDAVAAAYADKSFAYDEGRRVIHEDVHGGSESYLHTYDFNPEEPTFGDVNVWYSKTTETRPDGSVRTVYANRSGATILNKLLAPEAGGVWFHYFHYNSAGRLDLAAEPSAVESVDEPGGGSDDLDVSLRSHSGLVRIYSYYTTNNPTEGYVAGYLATRGVREGEDGATLVVTRFTYATHTVGEVSIHPLASEAVYPVAGGAGDTTRHYYCWYDNDDPGKGWFGYLTVLPGNEADVSELIVAEQTRTTWNEASQNVVTTQWQRFDDAEGFGELQGPDGPEPKARRTYQAQWYDGIGRPLAVADYGTLGGAELVRPATSPPRSDTVLVTRTRYGGDNLAGATIGPDGVETRWENDQAGRRIRLYEGIGGPAEGEAQAAACAGGTPRITEYAYAPDGGLARLTLINPVTGDQVTRWEYGTTLADSAIARSDLMRAKTYPPGGPGDDLSGVPSRTEYRYNRQKQVVESHDANGTVHAFDFDKLGRPVQDRVTSAGPGIADDILRIETTYDSKRLLRVGVTSYDNATVGLGEVLNEVTFAYDSFRQLALDQQEHQGGVNELTLGVAYGHEDGTHANTYAERPS